MPWPLRALEIIPAIAAIAIYNFATSPSFGFLCWVGFIAAFAWAYGRLLSSYERSGRAVRIPAPFPAVATLSRFDDPFTLWYFRWPVGILMVAMISTAVLPLSPHTAQNVVKVCVIGLFGLIFAAFATGAWIGRRSHRDERG